MAEPEDHTLYLLRDLRSAVQELDAKFDSQFDALSAKVDGHHKELRRRMDSLRQAINGESVLGRYAAAEVEERLADIERRLSAVENRS